MKKLKSKKIVSMLLAIMMLASTFTVFANETQTADGVIVLNSDDVISTEAGIGHNGNADIKSDYVGTFGPGGWARYLAYAEKSGEYKISFDMSRPSWTGDAWLSVYNEMQGMKATAVFAKSDGVRNEDYQPKYFNGTPWIFSTSATTDNKSDMTIYLNKGYNVLKVMAQDTYMYNIKLTPLFETPECYGFKLNGEQLTSVQIPQEGSATFDVYADEAGSYQLSLKVYSDYAEKLDIVTVNGKDYTGGAVDGDKKIEFITNWSERWSEGRALPTVDLKKGKNTVTLKRISGNNVPVTIYGLRFVKTSNDQVEETGVLKADITKNNLATHIPANSVIVDDENIILNTQNSANTFGLVTFKENFEGGTYDVTITLGETVSEETEVKIKALKNGEEINFTIPAGTLSNGKVTQRIELKGGVDTYLVTALSGSAKISKITFNNIDNPPALVEDDLPVVTLTALGDENEFGSDKFVKYDNSYNISFGSNDETKTYVLAVECDGEEPQFNVYVDTVKIYEKVLGKELGDLVFKKGDHNLKVEYVDSDPNITKITLNKKPEAIGESVTRLFSDAYDLSDGVTVGGDHIYMKGGTTAKFDFDMPKSGKYLLHLFYATHGGAEWYDIKNETTSDGINRVFVGSSKQTETIEAFTDGSQSTMAKNIIEFVAGKNVVRVKKSNNPGYIYKMTFEYIPTEVVVKSAKVGGVELLGYNKITPSADKIELTFSDNLNDSTLESHITVKDSFGEEYPFSVSAKDSTATLKLKKSLQPDMQYSIFISGVECANAEMTEDRTITFETREAISDGVTNITCDSVVTNLETVTAKGIVTNKDGDIMEGREVKMYLWPLGSTDKIYLGSAVSNENGEYVVSGSIDRSTYDSGKYGIYLVPQYDTSSYITESIIYVDSSSTTDIATAFANATTVELVKKVFEDYKNLISVKPQKDVLTVGENLYNHFISYELKDMNSFYEYYNKMYMFEGMRNSATVEDLGTFLYNEENCEKIGFDYDKISLITENKTDFLTEVKGITETSFDEYVEKFEEILENYLYTESKKTDIALNFGNISVTKGKEFKLELNGGKILENVKKIELSVDFGNANAIDSENCTLTSAQKGDKAVTIENGEVNAEYTYKELCNIQNLATLTFTAKTVGNYNVSYGGKIYYDFNGYEIVKEFTEGSFNFNVENVTVSTPSVRPGTSFVGGSTGGGGGGGYTPPKNDNIVNDNNNQTNNESEYFDDLKNHEWAKESIDALVKKGVISKDESKKFRPDDSITREEFVKMIISLLDIKAVSGNIDFNDLAKDHWAYSFIATAVENDIISGMGNGSFGVGENITREQMATIVARVLKLYNKTEASADGAFADDSDIADYAKNAVMTMKYYKIINGVGENIFAPKSNATRAQAAKIIYELSKVVGL